MNFFIKNDYPGSYPSTVSRKYIVNDLLKKMIFNKGKIPSMDVINPAHHIDTQQRMRHIVQGMAKDGLIKPTWQEGDDLVIEELGRQTAEKLSKRFNNGLSEQIRERMPGVIFYIIIFTFLSIVGIILYLMFHHYNNVNMGAG